MDTSSCWNWKLGLRVWVPLPRFVDEIVARKALMLEVAILGPPRRLRESREAASKGIKRIRASPWSCDSSDSLKSPIKGIKGIRTFSRSGVSADSLNSAIKGIEGIRRGALGLRVWVPIPRFVEDMVAHKALMLEVPILGPPRP